MNKKGSKPKGHGNGGDISKCPHMNQRAEALKKEEKEVHDEL